MRRESLSKSFITLLFVFLMVFLPSASNAQDIVISEIMFNPSGNENACEFVELVNRGDAPVSLQGFAISDSESVDLLIPPEDETWIVSTGGYALIVDPDFFDTPDRYPVPADIPIFTVGDRAIGNRGLSNTVAEPIMLISDSGDTLSNVRYSLDTPPGHSWERILPAGDDQHTNFAPSLTVGGTPGAPNSVLPPKFDPGFDTESVVIDQTGVFYGGSATVSVSYMNAGRDTTSEVTIILSICSLPPVSITFGTPVTPGQRSEAKQAAIGPLPGGMLSLETVITDGNSVSAANDTLRQSLPVTIEPGNLLINEVMAAPPDGASEWIELRNTGEWPVIFGGLRIGDSSGELSEMITGEGIIPSGGLGILAPTGIIHDLPENTPIAIVQGLPILNNDGDTVSLLDWNGTLIDNMTYDGTETGLSLELISPELRGTPDGWDVCVDPHGATPGQVNSIDYRPSVVNGGNSGREFELVVDPNPFGDITSISYRLPFPLARVRLRVYDRRGRLVSTLRDTEESGSEWSETWDGRSDGSRLPAGPYILNLEALDKRTGETHTERTVIVIGTQL